MATIGIISNTTEVEMNKNLVVFCSTNYQKENWHATDDEEFNPDEYWWQRITSEDWAADTTHNKTNDKTDDKTVDDKTGDKTTETEKGKGKGNDDETTETEKGKGKGKDQEKDRRPNIWYHYNEKKKAKASSSKDELA